MSENKYAITSLAITSLVITSFALKCVAFVSDLHECVHTKGKRRILCKRRTS